MREVAAQHDQKLQRLIRYVVRHRAVQAIEADALLKIVTRGLVNGFAQQRQPWGGDHARNLRIAVRPPSAHKAHAPRGLKG